MIRTREEIMDSLRSVLGEDNDNDETLSLLEDVTDTITDLESKATGTINVKETPEYLELERTWRKCYHDRFFGSVDNNDPDDPDDQGNPQEDHSPRSFDDLFQVKE